MPVKAFLSVVCLSIFCCLGIHGIASGADSRGEVKISYTLQKGGRTASKQIAVWIEDEGGRYLRTIFATRYTATGGYKKRPQSLPEWRKASGWENASQTEVDAVSGATQKQGEIELVWDCTDRNGNNVAAGTYIYKIEGNIEGENRILWQGRIALGGERSASTAEATYSLPNAAEKGVLVENVKAVYEPPR